MRKVLCDGKNLANILLSVYSFYLFYYISESLDNFNSFLEERGEKKGKNYHIVENDRSMYQTEVREFSCANQVSSRLGGTYRTYQRNRIYVVVKFDFCHSIGNKMWRLKCINSRDEMNSTNAALFVDFQSGLPVIFSIARIRAGILCETHSFCNLYSSGNFNAAEFRQLRYFFSFCIFLRLFFFFKLAKLSNKRL